LSLVVSGRCPIMPIRLSIIRRATQVLENSMGSRRRGSGRRKVGRKKRRMRSKIRHRK
jgi:hypothetical protein